MESQITLAGAPTPPPQPVVRADTRPTADAAAVVHNAKPDIPLPVPASLGPVGEVNKSRMAAAPFDRVTPVERTLKPYGVNMLPYAPSQGPDS